MNPESEFKEFIANEISRYCRENKDFEGNIRKLSDYDKDFICKHFLLSVSDWTDDILPPCTTNPRTYLAEVYSDPLRYPGLETIIREDIYNHLESKLDELMGEVWAEENNIKPEPFPGYEVGQ